MLKKLYIPFLLILCCFGTIANAQVSPDGILFQAVARDANGNAAASRNIYAKVSIIKGSATGTNVYQESFKVVSTDDGIFTLVIGKGARISGVAGLSSISWSDGLYFVNIKIAIEPSIPGPGWSADAEYVDMGTSQLWSVPYALFSTRSSIADSALSVSTIVPSSKGGTGLDNGGKTISIAQNLAFKGVGDITITTTATSNVSLPTTGLLANTQYVSDRIGTDTVSLSNRINALGIATEGSSVLKADKLNAIIDSSLYVNGKATVRDSLRVKGNVLIDSNLYVKGYLRIGGKLQLDSGLIFNDSLLVSRGARIDSSLIVKGKIIVRDSILAKGNVLIDSNLYVKGINILSKSNADSVTY